MELIEGQPVTTYCDAHGLGGQRLTQDVLKAVYAPEAQRPSAVVRLRAAGSRAARAGSGRTTPGKSVGGATLEGSTGAARVGPAGAVLAALYRVIAPS